jgi:6-phosphogluconolactonase
LFLIEQTGAVQRGAVQVITTADFPHSLQTDPSNRFLYVLCRTGEKIQRFNFDATAGTLSANSQDVTTPDSTGPRHLEFHPALHVVYVVNEFGRSVTAYRIDTSNGTLTAFQTLSLVPPNVAKPKAPNKGGADIHLTPDNRFLYATNRDPDELVAFSVDQVSGILTMLAHYPTESMPRAFYIDPTGKFMYVGGQSSGKLAAYRIDASTGQLTHIHTYHVGTSIVWVLLVQIKAE